MAMTTTILCIDEDPRVWDAQKALLEHRGYAVLVALTGAAGIELSRKHPIDVLILDFDMAGMHGDEVAAEFMKEQPKLPVVITTGSLDELPDSMKWFADALVQKVEGPEALLSAIENVIAISKAKESPSREIVTASNKRVA